MFPQPFNANKAPIELRDNSVIPVFFQVTTAADTNGWQFQGYVYADGDKKVPLLTFTVAWNPTTRIGVATYAPEDVTALVNRGDLFAVILGKPDTTYEVPFFEGPVSAKAGGPPWS